MNKSFFWKWLSMSVLIGIFALSGMGVVWGNAIPNNPPVNTPPQSGLNPAFDSTPKSLGDNAVNTISQEAASTPSTPWSSTSTPWTPAATPGKSPLNSTSFKFNPNSIAPTTSDSQYNKWTGNIKPFLAKIANILLIVVSTGAVLSIVIGGFYMAISGGDSEKANKGKIIITYNIIAICIALLSYGIIQFVTWIIWT